jgi:DNA polymerase (family 10)
MTELKSNLIKIFTQLSEIESLKGREYPSRAFSSVVKALQYYNRFKISDNTVLLRNSSTNEVKELGKSSSEIFIEYFNNGTCSRLENEPIYKSDLCNITGIGPALRSKLIKAGIYNSDDLNKLNLEIDKPIPGTDITFTSRISAGLNLWNKTHGVRITRELATQYITDFKQKVRGDIIVVGSYRRNKLTIGDIDIIMVNNGLSYKDAIIRWLDEVFVQGDTKISGIKGQTQVDIRMINQEYLGAHVLHGTGSAEFNIKVRAYAKSLGMRLNEYGILDKDNKFHTFDTEEQVFEFLGIDYVSPEMR